MSTPQEPLAPVQRRYTGAMNRRPDSERPDWYNPKEFRRSREPEPGPRLGLWTVILYALAAYGAAAIWRDYGHHLRAFL